MLDTPGKDVYCTSKGCLWGFILCLLCLGNDRFTVHLTPGYLPPKYSNLASVRFEFA